MWWEHKERRAREISLAAQQHGRLLRFLTEKSEGMQPDSQIKSSDRVGWQHRQSASSLAFVQSGRGLPCGSDQILSSPERRLLGSGWLLGGSGSGGGVRQLTCDHQGQRGRLIPSALGYPAAPVLTVPVEKDINAAACSGRRAG
ncbi:unnamed protein product [Pleuronectes platessa]|uniref:Uncharacterized protein n=1 Tax=Pleuronectes platessa TaxID=8262 RepID=A0A9N7TYE2_PLEPL|nr:unnamed protein product [Pleuronectes platessa]